MTARELWSISSHPIRTVAFSKITNVSWKTLLQAGQRAIIVSGRGSCFCAWQPAQGHAVAEPKCVPLQSELAPRDTMGTVAPPVLLPASGCLVLVKTKYLYIGKQRVHRTCPRSSASGLYAPVCIFGYGLGPPLVLCVWRSRMCPIPAPLALISEQGVRPE